MVIVISFPYNEVRGKGAKDMSEDFSTQQIIGAVACRLSSSA